jgi:hypothetical protein
MAATGQIKRKRGLVAVEEQVDGHREDFQGYCIGTRRHGPDIALGFALGGYEVTGVDIEEKPLKRSAQKISSNCRQMVEVGFISEKEANRVESRQDADHDRLGFTKLAWVKREGKARFCCA